MASEVLSKTITVQTFSPRTKEEPLDWAAIGLPVLGEAFATRLAAWRAQFATGRFVVPRFQRRKRRRKNRPRLNLKHAPESSGYWCGAVTIPALGDRMDWVEGQWAAPLVGLPVNPIGGQSYILSSWVGMDGNYGAGDVLQAGVDATIILKNAAIQYSYQPWWQWYPGQSHAIDGVAIAPGDVVACKIVMTQGSSTAATIVFSNLTNGQHCVFGVTSPNLATTLAGRCAEWVVEAFGSLGPMAGFQVVEFDNCYSGTVTGQTLASSQGSVVQMVNDAGMVLASAALNGPASVRVT